LVTVQSPERFRHRSIDARQAHLGDDSLELEVQGKSAFHFLAQAGGDATAQQAGLPGAHREIVGGRRSTLAVTRAGAGRPTARNTLRSTR
jgi:hypothetical protein